MRPGIKFQAKFGGTCIKCNGAIKPGMMIKSLKGNAGRTVYAHLDCLGMTKKQARKRRRERKKKWRKQPQFASKRSKGFVYVMDLKMNGLYKIGRTTSPWKRLEALQASNPDAEMITYHKVKNARTMEANLHNLFRDKWKTREIFLLDKDDLHTIELVLQEGKVD